MKNNLNKRYKNLKIYSKKKYVNKNYENLSFNKKLIKNRLKRIIKSYKNFYKKKFKKQKRYNIMFRTLNIFNKFYNKNGDPEYKKKWKIRKPFFLMSFYFRRYLKRYYGRLRNKTIKNIYLDSKKNIKKNGFFFFNYFENLESLLPIFLTRIGIFRNPMTAKVFIKNGKIFINDIKMCNTNYILKINDKISFDSSLFRRFTYKAFYKNRIPLAVYERRKINIPKRYLYKWFSYSSNIRFFLFLKRNYFLLKAIIFQFKLYLNFKKIKFKTLNNNIKKIIFNYFFNIIIINKYNFIYYNKFNYLPIKLKKKFIYRIKEFKYRKFFKFKKTYRPYNKIMAAGSFYYTRIRFNRFLLNVEYSKKLNIFIFMKKPIWDNINMYILNKNIWLENKKVPLIKKNLFTFFLDNYKKSII